MSDYVPRKLKPWLFIFFVLIVQFSGGLYLAAVTDMVGTTALMQEDILMAGYASLVGMAINFAVMFRIKFRFSARTQLLVCGIVLLAATFTYFTFALRKWSYRTMTAIGFLLAAIYLAWFYFFIDYGIEKTELFLPLFFRGAGSVIISIVYLTSIVQSGLPFTVFPQALTINGFTGAVMGAAFGPAVIGELFRKVMARNFSLLSVDAVDFNPAMAHIPFMELFGTLNRQALIVSIKEIYGLLLMIAVCAIFVILFGFRSVRPEAIFPKWRSIRRGIKRLVRTSADGA